MSTLLPGQYMTVDVVAAAIMAYKQNGNKIEKYSYPGTPATDLADAVSQVVSNRDHINRILDNVETIPTEMRVEAETCIKYLKNSLLMSVLGGLVVTSFFKKLCENIENEVSGRSSIGVLLYAPNTYYTALNCDEVKEKTNEYAFTSQVLGKVGDKISLDFVLLEKRYIQRMDCYSAYGHDRNGNLISFLTKHALLVADGKIRAKVKTSGADRWHNNAIVTSLNFVKVVK